MSEKVRTKRRYGILHELRHFGQLRTRARQAIIRNVLGGLGLVTFSVVMVLLVKAASGKFGF